MPSRALYYIDPRHSDTYVIELDEDGSFSYANRFMSEVCARPITYESIADIPAPVRSAIEQKIYQAQCQTPSPQSSPLAE